MTYFIDIDGTVLIHRKNKFCPGAKQMLRLLRRRGHRIVLITERGPRDDDKEYSMANTKRFFQDMGFEDIPIAFGVQPGRVIVDDSPGAYVGHRMNRDWSEEKLGDVLHPRGM